MANRNFFDLVITIIAPEIKELELLIKGTKNITKLMKERQLTQLKQFQKALPQLKGPKETLEKAKENIKKALGKSGISDTAALGHIFANPRKFSESLNKMSAKERKALGESIADATGGIDEAKLDSSWIASGIYEESGFGVGTLTLTLDNGHSYDYYNVPVGVWETMKKANGAGKVFWALYLRKYKRSRGAQRVALAFRLSK